MKLFFSLLSSSLSSFLFARFSLPVCLNEPSKPWMCSVYRDYMTVSPCSLLWRTAINSMPFRMHTLGSFGHLNYTYVCWGSQWWDQSSAARSRPIIWSCPEKYGPVDNSEPRVFVFWVTLNSRIWSSLTLSVPHFSDCSKMRTILV